MARTAFTLQGDDTLIRQLAALDRATRGKRLKVALVAGALLIVNEWNVTSPYRTGNYRRSQHVGGEGAAGGLEGGTTGTDIGGQEIGRDYVEVAVGSNVEYAAAVEFRPGRGGHLRRAIESTRSDVQREIAGALRAQMRKAV